MRTIILTFAVSFLLFSCVDVKPFRVGSDIDASWQIRNLYNTPGKFVVLARRLCPVVKNSRVAVVDFVNMNSNDIDKNGRFLGYLLANDLNEKCQCYADYVGTPTWFDYKTLRLSNYPEKYNFGIVGSFRYDNGCWDVFVRLVDLKLGVVYKSYAFVVPINKVRFSIEPLHIPDDVEFP